jgi:sugar diacid utilization regulator
MIPEGLQKLRCEDGKGGESDGWRTLKVYLDNEMNGMQTARDLYIHRTTLQNRLRRIEQLVDLGTPQKRLYIRYCMYLYEMYDEMKN